MSCSRLAKVRRLQSWVYQRARESLSHPTRNLLWPSHSRQSNWFPTAKSAPSTQICPMAIVFRRLPFLPSALKQPFNAHRASFVERLSPIHF
jgi:hypothetical protein